MQEKVVEIKLCKHCNLSFDITDKDLEFYEKVSPVFWWQKYNIPSPALCPDCRQQRRLSFRNERKLYKRKCDLTWKNIISIYSPDKSYKVYDNEAWWGDKWNAMDYGKEFDFSKNFFEQFNELMVKVPVASIISSYCENSAYCNFTASSKNCYYVFACNLSENCLYWRNIRRCNNCMDCLQIIDSENCYWLTIWAWNYNTHLSYHVFWCRDSMYLWYCDGCNNCFCSTNLKNKEYYIFNKPHSKEEYNNFIKNLSSSDILKYKNDYEKLISKSVHRSKSMLNNDWFCSDDFIRNSSNVLNSFNISDSNNLKYCTELESTNDCIDCDIWVWEWNTYCYESTAIPRNNNKNIFIVISVDSSNIMYSSYCYWCSNLFGCIWLRDKSYCILNKQYTKEQYEELVPKIIEHIIASWEWWEFFPGSISPFGYNETIANEFFPISPPLAPPYQGGELEKVPPLIRGRLGGGFNWSTYEAPFPKVDKIISANKLPDDIFQIPDDILNWAIECEVTKKPFKIISQELEFYRKYNLPIPKRHPDIRHLDRMTLRNPRRLYDRKCDKCWKDMKTTYNPDRLEIVYCEECYNKTMY